MAAAIQAHNPQDFNGEALPSGASIDSRAPSSVVAALPGPQALSRGAEFEQVPGEHMQAQFEAAEALRSRLLEAGLTVGLNSGEGNLCLIMALLQRAGVPDGEVDERARQVRDELAGRPDGLGLALQEGMGLYADRQVFQVLAEHIFGQHNVPSMLVMTAGEHGSPLLYERWAITGLRWTRRWWRPTPP